MGEGRRSLREVELVEEDEAPVSPSGAAARGSGGAGGSGGGRAGAARPWRRRLRRWWPAAGGVVLVLVAGQLVLDARERAELARFADVPGVLRPLTPPLSVHPYEGALPFAAAVAGLDVAGLRLTTDAGPEHQAHAVVAYDPDSGAEVWRTDLAQGATGWVNPICDAAPGRTVICAAQPIDEYGAQLPGPTRVVALRGRDGTQVWARDEQPGAQLSVSGDLAVVAYEAPAGSDGRAPDSPGVVVARLDAATGEHLWERHLESVHTQGLIVGSSVFATAHRDHVMLWADNGAWVLGADGREVASTTNGILQDTRTTDLFLIGSRTQLIDAQGRRPVDVDGTPVNLGVDDGSVPDLVFLTGPGLSAVDSTARRVVWTDTAVPSVDSAVLLGDVLYGITNEGLHAWDARTGAERWRVDVTPGYSLGFMLSTDGRDLYAIEGDGHGASVLSAFSRSDGHRSWSWTLPDGGNGLWAANGTLWSLPDDFQGTYDVVD